MYEKYRILRDNLGLKDSDVAKGCGIGRSTFSDWKNGRSTPKTDKLQKIASFLGVDMSWFSDSKSDEPFYINTEARELSQFLFENPEYRILFDASRNVKKEDIAFVKEMLDKFSSKD